MNYNSTGSRPENSSYQNRADAIVRWEKYRSDGKRLWLFKRSAAWLTAVIVLFGAANFLFPETIKFQGTHVFIAVLMFGGYLLGSLNEWSKMEKLFESRSFQSEI